MTRSLARGLIYPALVVAGFAVPVLGLRSGWSATVVTAAVNLAGCAAVVLLERWLPYREQWSRPHGDVGTDAAHAVLSNLVPLALFRALVYGWLVGGSVGLQRAWGAELWPGGWPLALQVLLGLLLGEFLMYWYHRWLHTSALGWRLHAVHHSAPRLYWLNGLRAHPLDVLGGFTLTQAPLVLLGAPEAVMVLAAGFIGINGMLKHSNVDLRHGPLNRVFSTAELHRWHHSPDLAESQANYGNNLVVWDVLFGTWLLPADRQPPAGVGLGGEPYPEDWMGQVAAPFRRQGASPAA
jgi:sterol desaturase/sphingolipid hydroxylase (fatty acid hydroxylase superfamily)